MLRSVCCAVLLMPGVASGSECVDLSGDARQGGLLFGQVAPASEVTLGDRRVPVLADGQFLLGLGRDAPAEMVLTIADGETCEQRIVVAQRDYRIQRVNGVPQRTVTPPTEQLERIRRERELVRAEGLTT